MDKRLEEVERGGHEENTLAYSRTAMDKKRKVKMVGRMGERPLHPHPIHEEVLA
jgi:hypothetical protein